MPKYLIGVDYTLDGLRGVLAQGGTARRAPAQSAAESVGGSLGRRRRRREAGRLHGADGSGEARLVTAEDAKSMRVALLTLTERLIAEYEGAPAGRVIAVVVRCRHQLAVAGVHGVGLVDATESMARTTLSQAA